MTVIKLPERDEWDDIFLDAARLRMKCYKAHQKAGFDHESSIMFTAMDCPGDGLQFEIIEEES